MEWGQGLHVSQCFHFIFNPCPVGWFLISKDTDDRQSSLTYLPEQSFGSFNLVYPEDQGGEKLFSGPY